MPIHPIEYRYFNKEMRDLFTEEAKLQNWLDVEAALAKAHAEVGNITRDKAEEIARKANLKYIKLKRVDEIEKEIHHDVMAMVKALNEQCVGDAGNYIHYGATSYDIVDTALALQMKKALEIIKEKVLRLLKTLIDLCEQHKETVVIGRTHGQQAIPTTFGMKFAIWAKEVDRNLMRLDEVYNRCIQGKMSGAVGTMASFGEKGFEIQDLVMINLGLIPTAIANQVIQRDIHAEVIVLLAFIASTADKIAREIRNLQRTEIGEMFEPFSKNQVGSSTMSHKRNPHKSERIVSLARRIKSNIIVAFDNIALEHERDLTNSANERIIIPESFILTDYIVSQLISILKGIEFNFDNIQRNLELTHGQIFSEKIMIELVKKGIGRQDAHEILRQAVIESRKEGKNIEEIISKNPTISDLVTVQELSDWLNPKSYIGTAVQQVEKVVEQLKKRL
ncbi:MAG TPA: adenylosuccinate lyase [Candidatus Deferrimicrobium sp.]|nr:adenylosuccinate lyase [Candidatus Deferrimicrobium sp.]